MVLKTDFKLWMSINLFHVDYESFLSLLKLWNYFFLFREMDLFKVYLGKFYFNSPWIKRLTLDK